MILESENVRLVPFSEPWHMEYLWGLLSKSPRNEISKEQFREGKYYWLGYANDVLCGVLYLCFYPFADSWVLNAYRDDRALIDLPRFDWSLSACKLVCEYFFSLNVCDILYSMVDEKNIRAHRVIEEIGFERTGKIVKGCALWIKRRT